MASLDSENGPSATTRPFFPETILPSFSSGFPATALPWAVSRSNQAIHWPEIFCISSGDRPLYQSLPRNNSKYSDGFVCAFIFFLSFDVCLDRSSNHTTNKPGHSGHYPLTFFENLPTNTYAARPGHLIPGPCLLLRRVQGLRSRIFAARVYLQPSKWFPQARIQCAPAAWRISTLPSQCEAGPECARLRAQQCPRAGHRRNTAAYLADRIEPPPGTLRFTRALHAVRRGRHPANIPQHPPPNSHPSPA